MSRVAALSRSPGETRLALIEDDLLTELRIERDHDPSLVGRYFAARVTRLQPELGGAFVSLGDGREAFLRLDLHRQMPDEGALIVVQIDQDGAGAKLPRARASPAVAGSVLILDPAGGKPRVSRRVTRPADRKRLMSLAHRLAGNGTVIMRLGAERATEDALAAELELLRKRWRELRDAGAEMTAPREISAFESAAGAFLRDRYAGHLDEIIFDHAGLKPDIERVRSDYRGLATARLTFHQDAEPLFEHLGIEAQIEIAANPSVILPRGGELHFERTRGAVIIDVDTAGARLRGPASNALTSINREAADEIVRQIRLRDLGGILVIDFAGATVQGVAPEILDRLKLGVRVDPQNVRLLGRTKLGLVEMTRRRERRALDEILFAGGADGRPLSPVTACLSALRRLAFDSRRPGAPHNAVLRASPEIVGLLEQGALAAAREVLSREWGVTLKIVADQTITPDRYEVTLGT